MTRPRLNASKTESLYMPPLNISLPTALPHSTPAPSPVRVTDSHGTVATAKGDGADTASGTRSSSASTPGVQVQFSPAALQQAQAVNPNQDIDDADLPDTIKDLLKMIRELRTQLTERLQDLQKLMADASLSDTERSQQAQQIQAEISGLNSAIATATGQLLKAMKAAKLSDAQSANAAALLAG